MRNAEAAIALDDLGALRIRGPDAVQYLQGQLSQDIERVSSERSLRAGFHNAQGRVIALLRLVWIAANDLLAILPRELAPTVAPRLAKFILRAKVTIADESDRWDVHGFIGTGALAPDWPRARDSQLTTQDRRIVCVGEAPSRWMQIVPHAAGAARMLAPDAAEIWRRHEIEAGEPQVFASTSETFVSQMLNLDLLDAISFEKGCYTGQEIIARAHYRGRMKRRMQRFRAIGPPALEPGAHGRLPDGRGIIVVRAARIGDAVEFLAVTSLPDSPHGAPESTAGVASPDTAIAAVQQPLPYTLPA
ncbi:MAG: YgfZ/GcvT domain-containing protein [Steroidobacteraceae bacterium]